MAPRKVENEFFRQKDSLSQGVVSCVSKNLFSKAPWHGAQPHIKSKKAYLKYSRANMAADGLNPKTAPIHA